MIRLEGERRRSRRPYLDEAVRGHRAVDAERVRSLQRYRVHNRTVLLFQRLLAHAVKALHRENVQLVANSISLCNLERLLPSRIDHVLVLEGVTLLCSNGSLSRNWFKEL